MCNKMYENVKSLDYTKNSLQSDSDPTTMEVVTRTNAVKSLSDKSIFHLSESKCTVSKRAKGANRCKIGQRVQKLDVQNLRCIAKK